MKGSSATIEGQTSAWLSMGMNRRKAIRRTIGYGAKIFASDGSWHRDCRVLDVSASGAKIEVDQPKDLPDEFVLALSMHGNAMRQCHVVWAKARQLGVKFERRKA